VWVFALSNFKFYDLPFTPSFLLDLKLLASLLPHHFSKCSVHFTLHRAPTYFTASCVCVWGGGVWGMRAPSPPPPPIKSQEANLFFSTVRSLHYVLYIYTSYLYIFCWRRFFSDTLYGTYGEGKACSDLHFSDTRYSTSYSKS
jgi:hypothetical protein